MRRSLWLSIVLLVAVIAVSTLVSCKDEPEKAVPLTEDTTVWENGKTYTLTRNVKIDGRITVTGNVRLLLSDGMRLNASYGITVNAGSSLTIDGGAKGTGELDATSQDPYQAAIGGGARFEACGTVVINGGQITAQSNRSGAGIGGAGDGAGGTITINGGNIMADGAYYGAGIGGGHCAAGGTVTINGGTVTAVGGDFSPSNFADGIGAGASESECGTLKIGPQVALYGDNTDGNTHIGDGPMNPYTGERFKVMGAMKKTAPFTKHAIMAP
ncbi:MAG: hypothetical protein II493_06675 [Spirochaetales bacterium]|nr:hypothetical protein [Spirochaetales bacterium]